MAISTTMNVHNVEGMKAVNWPGNCGTFRIEAFSDAANTFDITIFTGSDPLAADLADAINAVLEKHGRLGRLRQGR